MLGRTRYRAKRCLDSRWVFCREDATQLQSIKYGFGASIDDAKLGGLHPRDPRRTFGSWLVESGIRIGRVSELLRHSDIAITPGAYAQRPPAAR